MMMIIGNNYCVASVTSMSFYVIIDVYRVYETVYIRVLSYNNNDK